MNERGKSRFSILGALSSGPKSGYDIKKMTEISTGHFWAESYGNLYPTLRRLEGDGLVEAELRPQRGKPDRRLYRLTEAGRRALDAWLGAPVEDAPVRNELLLKLFFGHRVPTEVSAGHVESFRTRQAERLETYSALEAWLRREHEDAPELPFWLMTLAFGRCSAEAALRWCEESKTMLEALKQRGRSE